MLKPSDIQHTRLKGEKKFQDFCLDLARAYWNDKYAELHGRSGQRQRGVDISAYDFNNGGVPVGMQCKGSENHEPRVLTKKEVANEIEAAKTYRPPLKLLIIAYNGYRDQKIQEEVRLVNVSHLEKGLFRVVLWSWDEIIVELPKFPNLYWEYFFDVGIAVSPPIDPRRGAGVSTALGVKLAVADRDAILGQEPGFRADDDPVGHAKIDIFKEQIAAGNGRSVLKPLRAFIDSFTDLTSSRIRFRAHANLGAALSQCGAFDEAAEEFDRAANSEGDTADSHAYAARAAMMRGDNRKALQESQNALEIDGTNRLAASIYIDVAPPNEAVETIEARVGPLAAAFDVGWALARFYGDRGEHDHALRAAEAIAEDEENWARPIAVGEAILRRFEQNIAMRLGSPIDVESQELLDRARSALEAGWSRVADRGDRKNWAFVANNLSVTYSYLGQVEASDDLALKAYAFSPDTLAFQQRAALAYIHRNEIDEAVSMAERSAVEGSVEAALFASSVFSLKGDWVRVAEWARKALDEAQDDSSRARAAEHLITAELQLRPAAEVWPTVGKLRELFAPNLGFEARAAEVARRLGNNDALSAARQRLASFDVAALGPLERLELAEAWADDGQWSAAADLLDGLHPSDRPTEILRRRLLALFRANRWADARTLYQSLTESGRKAKEIYQLGAAIYERSGMLSEATKALQQAIDLDPLDLRSRLDWVRLSLRNGEEDAAALWLKEAELELTGEPEDYMELAQLLSRYGRRREALNLAYETMRNNWGKSERLHVMFMALFLIKEPGVDDDFLHPALIDRDCAVTVVDEYGTENRFVIEDTSNPTSDILPPDSPFAKELLGASVGDERISEPGLGQQRTWTVKEISHKFLDLFHRALAKHPTLFPGSKAIGSFHIESEKEGGFEPIFEQARQRAKYVDEISQYYRDNLIPIDVVSKMLGIDPIDASLGIRFKKKIPLDSCVGTDQERAESRRQIDSSESIIVDPITIAIWNDIGLLAEIHRLDFPVVEVVQATIDLFAQRADFAAREIGTGGGSLEAMGDKIAFIEVPDDVRRQVAANAVLTLERIRGNTSVVPTEPLADAPNELESILSDASLATIGTAARQGKALICDDRRLRVAAAAAGVKRAGWTQGLLLMLVETGRMDGAEYVRFASQLVEQNITFVSVRLEDLHIARTIDNHTYFTLVDALTRSTVEPRTLLVIAINFIVQLYLQSELRFSRDRLVSQILEGILRRSDCRELISVLIDQTYKQITQQMKPISFILADQWIGYVERFWAGHFLQSVFSKSD